MARSGKLKAALKDFKAEDPLKLQQARLRSAAEKKKRKREVAEPDKGVDIAAIDDTTSSEDDDEEQADEDEWDEEDEQDQSALNAQLNGSSAPTPKHIPTNGATKHSEAEAAEQEEGDDAEQDEDIPYSDIASLDSEDRGDVVPYQRLTINNHAALATSLARIALPLDSLAFSAHQTITSAEPTTIKDIDDDLGRELAFYAQALAAVKRAKHLLKTEGGVPFARPTDYFAEMVKSEEHMGRVRQRLVEDAASKRAAADARRQRDLKKFGKAVQVAKIQERDRDKRVTMDKINTLKRKRSNALPTAENEEDLFDVALDEQTKSSRTSKSSKAGEGAKNHKRARKDQKYGFGGKKRHGKSGDAQSSSDMRDFSARGMKSASFGRGGGGAGGNRGKQQRLGKSRRKARA